MTSIYKGDDTRAFGGNFINIKINNPDLYKISKIIFAVNGGVITKTFTDENYFQVEETNLTVNFTSKETLKLNAINIGNLLVYDEHGYQETCVQSIQFNAQNGVINNAKCCC